MADLPPMNKAKLDFLGASERVRHLQAGELSPESVTSPDWWHTNECAVHSPTLRPCSCGLETRLRSRAESAERERDLWKLKWKQLNDDLAEALDELDSLRNKTKPKR